MLLLLLQLGANLCGKLFCLVHSHVFCCCCCLFLFAFVVEIVWQQWFIMWPKLKMIFKNIRNGLLRKRRYKPKEWVTFKCSLTFACRFCLLSFRFLLFSFRRINYKSRNTYKYINIKGAFVLRLSEICQNFLPAQIYICCEINLNLVGQKVDDAYVKSARRRFIAGQVATSSWTSSWSKLRYHVAGLAWRWAQKLITLRIRNKYMINKFQLKSFINHSAIYTIRIEIVCNAAPTKDVVFV